MPIRRQPEQFLRSLAADLEAQANRVRDLIGDAHWLSDGRHKERLLTSVVRNHCPPSMDVSTGFVISHTQGGCSREQDLLVVDCSREVPLFREGGLAIAFPRSVVAAISVKTTFDLAELRDSALTLMTARKILADSGVDPRQVWCGAYFFGSLSVQDAHKPFEWFQKLASEMPSLSLNGTAITSPPFDLFASSGEHAFIVGPRDEGGTQIRGFSCGGLATAVFLAHLIDHMAVRLKAPRSDFSDFADVDVIKRFGEQSVQL